MVQVGPQVSAPEGLKLGTEKFLETVRSQPDYPFDALAADGRSVCHPSLPLMLLGILMVRMPLRRGSAPARKSMYTFLIRRGLQRTERE